MAVSINFIVSNVSTVISFINCIEKIKIKKIKLNSYHEVSKVITLVTFRFSCLFLLLRLEG